MLFESLINHPSYLLFSTFLLSLLIGSFLNVVIYRLPVMLNREWQGQCRELLKQPAEEASNKTFNLAVPRSCCPQCGHQISAWENIPIISYLLLRGRCKACKTHIPMRYPLIELLTAMLSLVVVWHFGPSLQAVVALFLTWSLIALTFIDLDHQLLPDNITLPLLWLGLMLSLFGIFGDPTNSIIGALVGYLSLWSVFWAFKLLTGKEGMGYGDFKLLAALGAWLGWQAIPAIILISSLLGSIVGLSLLLMRRHEQGKPIPFGPYIAAAGWIALIWGQPLTQYYLDISGL